MLKQNLHFKFLPRGPKTQLLLYWSAIKGPPKGSNSTMTNDQTSGRTHVNKCLWSRFNTQQLDKSPNEYITVGLKPFWSRIWNVLLFRFSEKATFDKISHLFWRYWVNVKTSRRFFQIVCKQNLTTVNITSDFQTTKIWHSTFCQFLNFIKRFYLLSQQTWAQFGFF